MATVLQTVTYPTVTGLAGGLTQAYIDAYSLSKSTAVPQFAEKVYPGLWKNYGEGFLMLDWLRGADREFDVDSDRLTAFQETYDERPITFENAIATNNAGESIYFKLDASDYAADGNGTYLRVGNVIELPMTYFTISNVQPTLPVNYKVTTATTSGGTLGGLTPGTGADTVYTAVPFNVLAKVAVQIPAGIKVVVGGTAYGRGTAGIGGVNKNDLQYDFFTTIAKEGCSIEGGIDVFQLQYGGQTRLWSRSLFDTERRLDRQQDYIICNGQRNTNTSVLTQASYIDNVARPVLSTEGIMQRVARLGMDLPIVNGGSFEFDDFDAIRELLEAKGITNGNLTFHAGSDLYSQVENCPFDWIDSGYSPGTDLRDMSAFGVNFKAFKRNSYAVQLCELSGLSRPTGYGAIDGMKMQGIIMTEGKTNVSIDAGNGLRDKRSLPNFAIGYMQGRRRIMKPIGGHDEHPYVNSTGYDASKMEMLTEFMVFNMDADKMIHVYESSKSS